MFVNYNSTTTVIVVVYSILSQDSRVDPGPG